MKVFIVFVSVLIKISLSSASGSSCSISSTCIVPQPPVSAVRSTLVQELRDVQCEMGCIAQHSVDLPVINANTPWPSLEFAALQNDCPLYQKIFECKMGCISRFETPSLSINRCRDSCYAECENDMCSRGSCEQMPCGRQCRKTYSRFGCMLHNSFNNLNRSHSALTALTTAPLVTQVTDLQDPLKQLYRVSPELSTSGESGEAPTVAFIVRVASVDNGNVDFMWQRNLSTPIDLSSYACQHVSVSHAVVSTLTPMDDLDHLPYSPAAVICVPGVGGHPSAVDVTSMRVVYTEDFRPDFNGYSQATVHWQRPEGYRYVTSYSLSVYPDRDSCGGQSVVYSYNNIDKELTNFTIVAKEPTGLLKFGCSFLFELLARPTDVNEIGPHISSIAQLTGPAPQLNVNCNHVWDTASGNFNISVSWGLLPNNTPTDHIRGFTVSPVLLNNGEPEISYSPQTINPQNGETEFQALLSQFEPLTGQQYKVEVQSTKDSDFYWRPNPTTGSCVISAEPHPPNTPTEISISGFTFDESQDHLSFVLRWGLPLYSYGNVAKYQVRLLTEADMEFDLLDLPADTSVASVASSLPANVTGHCAYVQMRSVNVFSVSGDWSERLVIPLDDQCLTDATDDNGKISLFYENEEQGNVKLLELGCHSDSALFAGASQSVLTEAIQNIQQQVQGITSAGDEQSTKLTTLEENLLRVEQKLDALLELVANHVHGG